MAHGHTRTFISQRSELVDSVLVGFNWCFRFILRDGENDKRSVFERRTVAREPFYGGALDFDAIKIPVLPSRASCWAKGVSPVYYARR